MTEHSFRETSRASKQQRIQMSITQENPRKIYKDYSHRIEVLSSDPELTALRFVRKPLDAENGYEADPSHSEITGLPQGDSPEAALIAECIQAIHPAIIDG